MSSVVAILRSSRPDHGQCLTPASVSVLAALFTTQTNGHRPLFVPTFGAMSQSKLDFLLS